MQELINDIADDAEARGSHNRLMHTLRANLKTASGAKNKNLKRTLNRKLLKGNGWPPVYTQNIRLWDLKRSAEVERPVCFLLPHEIVARLYSLATVDKIFETISMDRFTRDHLEECELKAGCRLLGLGLWGDGVPCNWDRDESVNILSLTFPGLGPDFSGLRIPIVAVPDMLFSKNTWDDIMDVVSESFIALAKGEHWSQRPDGKPWQSGDSKRKRDASKPLGVRACLCEVRGDWKFYKEIFRFPQFNEKAGCCWICRCTPEQDCIGSSCKIDLFLANGLLIRRRLLMRRRQKYTRRPTLRTMRHGGIQRLHISTCCNAFTSSATWFHPFCRRRHGWINEFVAQTGCTPVTWVWQPHSLGICSGALSNTTQGVCSQVATKLQGLARCGI